MIVREDKYMTVIFRVILCVIALCTTFWIMRKIRASKLQIEYSIFWILFSVLLVILAVFPQIMTYLAGIMGVYSTTNLLFAVFVFILLIKMFMMTIEIGTLQNRIKELVQKIALQECNNQENKVEE